MTKEYPIEKERCSCGAWMKEFDTSFYVPELQKTIPHALRMCVNPRCPESVSKDFVPPVPRKSDTKRTRP